MNRKSLTILWVSSWIVCALSFALAIIPMESSEWYGRRIIMGELSAALSWVWFGLTLLSPVLTRILWEELGVKTRIFGLLYPGFFFLALVAILFLLDFFFALNIRDIY